MSKMDKPEMIYTLIPAIMADITAIGKDKTNAQQGFKFRGVDDVMNVLKPILTKYQVFAVPEVLDVTREVKTTQKGGELRYSLVRYRVAFYAPDGSHVDAITYGEGMDSGDKASNKAMAIAFKYALFQVFCIPTEEMPDPDADTPPETVPPCKSFAAMATRYKVTLARIGEVVARLQAEGRIPEGKVNDMAAEDKAAAMRVIERELREPTAA